MHKGCEFYAKDQGIALSLWIVVWIELEERYCERIKSPSLLSSFPAAFHDLPVPLRRYFPMAERPEVSSQFTEDAFAKQDRYCEWPKCGVLICQGEPQYYIATIKPGQQRRRVCSSCNLHYLRKPATTVHKTAAVQSDQVRTSSANNARTDYARPDPHKIQQSVNAAQRGLSINPPRVVAVSRGPDVAVPSARHADRGPFPPAPLGYSS